MAVGGTEVGKAYVSAQLDQAGLQNQLTNMGGMLGSKFGPMGVLLGNLLGKNLGDTLQSKGGVAAKLGEAFGMTMGQSASKGVDEAAPEAEQSVGKLAGVFGAAGPWGLAAGAAVAASAAIGVGLYKLGGDFESNYRTIARNTGDTGRQLDSLKTAFNNVLAATPASMGQVTSTIVELQRYTGPTSAALETLSKQLITVSRISGTDVATNVEAATHALENWNIPTKQAPALMNALYTVSQKSGASFEQLATQVTKFGPQMRLMGVSFSQSAAMIGTFDKAGINSQQLMMGLGMAASKVAKQRETADAAVTSSQLKLSAAVANADNTVGKAHITAMAAVTKAQQELTDKQEAAALVNRTSVPESLNATIKQIKSAKTETDALSAASAVWSGRTAVQMVDAVRSGKFNFDEMNKAIENNRGSIENTAKRTQTLSGAMGTLRNSTEVALQPMASTVWKDINKDLIAITKSLIPIVQGLSKDLPPAMAKLAPLFHLIGNEAKTTFQTLGDAIKVAVPLFKILFDAIGLILDLLTGKWGKAWNDATAIFRAFGDVLKNFPRLIEDAILAPFRALGINVSKSLGDLWSTVSAIPGKIVSYLADLAGDVLGAFVGAFTGLGAAIGSALSDFWNYVTQIPATVVKDLVSLGGDVFNAIASGFSTAASGAESGISAIWGWASGVPGRIVGFFASLGGQVFSALAGGFGQALGGAMSGISALEGWLGGLGAKLISDLGDIGTQFFNLGDKIASKIGDGIKASVGKITGAISGALGKLGGFIGLSPAVEGPLSGSGDLVLRGQMLMERLATGITQGSSAVNSALSAALNPAAGAGVTPALAGQFGGSAGPAVYIENATFNDKVDLEAFMKNAAWVASTSRL